MSITLIIFSYPIISSPNSKISTSLILKGGKCKIEVHPHALQDGFLGKMHPFDNCAPTALSAMGMISDMQV